MSHLQPTPIVDINGKATTVHRRPAPVSTKGRLSLPSPRLNAPQTYASRVKDIAARNEAWRAGQRPPETERNAAAAKALESMGDLTLAALNISDQTLRWDFAINAKDLITQGDFEMLTTAVEFAPIVLILTESINDKNYAEEHTIDFQSTDLIGWETTYWGSYDFHEASRVVSKLRKDNLLAYDDVPTRTDNRFFAHLYMSATNTLNYEDAWKSDNDIIHLVDEFPERTAEIKRYADEEMHAAAIRAILTGESPAPLAEGAL